MDHLVHLALSEAQHGAEALRVETDPALLASPGGAMASARQSTLLWGALRCATGELGVG